MVELGIGSQLFQDFMEREEKFSNTVRDAALLSEVWWERQGRMNLGNKSFNVALWYINMRNRFRWGDNGSRTNDDGLPIQIVSYRDVKSKIVAFNYFPPAKPESEAESETA